MWLKREKYVSLVKESNTAYWLQVEVDRLDEEIVRLRTALEVERAKSDEAVDRMLQVKGLPPVTPVKPPSLEELSSLFEEDPTAVREIVKDIGERGAAEVLLDK